MSTAFPTRSAGDLTDAERRQLDDAHAELRDAVAAYEPYLGTQPRPDEPLNVVHVDNVRRAQERIEAAEARLWQLREQLLGWARPPWAPRAELVSDWFSDEDAAYDELTDSASS